MELEKVREWVSSNKGRAAAVAVALVLALGGLGLAAASGAFTTQPEAQQEGDANPSAKDAKDEADEAKDDAKVDETPVKTPADKPASASVDKPAVDKPASNGNTSASNGGGSANKPASKPSAPSHTHAWKNHTATKQVWVSKIVPVYENQQVQVGTNKVSEGFFWHCNCGAVIPRGQDADHAFNHIANNEPDNGYVKEHFREEPVYENKQVQVGTRDDGHYETQSYTDYQYCDCGAKK